MTLSRMCIGMVGVVGVTLVVAGCGAGGGATGAPGGTNPAHDDGGEGGGTGGLDAGQEGQAGHGDAASDSGAGDAGSADSGQIDPTDGPPTRVACTNTFGSALTMDHGRLDGRLVAMVPTTTHGCNGDSTHLHLQIAMNGATYDVAVNLDAQTDEIDAPLPDGPWSEGWHTSASLDYVSALGLHDTAFTAGTPASIELHLESTLAKANHISIFATGYGPTGAHLVHRQGNGRDGAIFIDPLSPSAHAIVFRFDTQSF